MALTSKEFNVARSLFCKYLATICLMGFLASCAATASRTPEPRGPLPGNAVININNAGELELQELEGIGPKTAKKIIEYRTRFGRFRRPADIMLVEGIGEKHFVKIRNRVRTE